jgi:hypothetical protein
LLTNPSKEESKLEEQALDLLEAAYRKAEYHDRGGHKYLLTFLDGDVALSVGLKPHRAHTPEGHAYRSVVATLINSGAVWIPEIPDQGLARTTFYEITPRGEEMLREAGRSI